MNLLLAILIDVVFGGAAIVLIVGMVCFHLEYRAARKAGLTKHWGGPR